MNTDPLSWATAPELLVALLTLVVALWLRPWRMVGQEGPPWPWLALTVSLPWLWQLDRHAATPLALPMSGASLLVLMAGWPLAVIGFAAAGLACAFMPPGEPWQALHRMVWLGILPATVALGVGAGLRRWLPHHLFVYILGRGFFGTLAALLITAVGASLGHPAPEGTTTADWLVARVLAAFGEAFVTGLVTAIGVAFRPHWLATYTDRLYLPPAGS